MAESAPDAKAKKVWLPLESDPELLDKYMYGLGVKPTVRFAEVYGLDEELLGLVPRPVHAVMMLFPVSEESEKARIEEAERLKSEGYEAPSKIFWMKQIVGNACGTIALIHALANNRESGAKVVLKEGKFLSKFLSQVESQGADPAVALEEDDDIEQQHQEIATEAKSDPNAQINDDLHFIAFVNVDGIMYELDGRKTGPIPHGPVGDDLLASAVRVAQEFVARKPSDPRFSLLALVDNEDYVEGEDDADAAEIEAEDEDEAVAEGETEPATVTVADGQAQSE